MSKKYYMLYCEYCNFKKVTDGTAAKDMYEVKTSPIPGGRVAKDPETDKQIRGKPIVQPRKLRCPQCGKIVIPRKIPDPQGELDEKREMEERNKRINEEKNQFNGSQTSPERRPLP